MAPDFDAYTPDAVDPASLAGKATDVEAGMPFAGALFRFDDVEERFKWVNAYSADDPARFPDVVGEFGPGVYKIRTLPGYPHEASREFEVEATTPGRRTPRGGAGGGSTPAPVVPPDEMTRIRASIEKEADERHARRTADAEATHKAEAARLTVAKQAAEDRADRHKRELDEVSATVARLRSELADAVKVGAEAQAASSAAQLKYSQDLSAEERRHMNELMRLKEQVSDLNAQATIHAMELRQAQNGEGTDAGDRLIALAETVGVPLLAQLTQRMNQPSPAAYAAPAGDGHAGTPYPPAPPATPWQPAPSAGALPATDARPDEEKGIQGAAPVDDGTDDSPLDRVFGAAQAAIAGDAAAPDTATFTALVERARPDASADDWRAIGADLLSLAVEYAAEPARVASYLAPIVAPAAATIRPVLSMTSGIAAQLVAGHFGLNLDKQALAYVGRVLKALKPLVAGVVA